MSKKKKVSASEEKQIEAAFKVVHQRLLEFIANSVPFFVRGEASSMLESDEGKQTLREICEEALEAAEKA